MSFTLLQLPTQRIIISDLCLRDRMAYVRGELRTGQTAQIQHMCHLEELRVECGGLCKLTGAQSMFNS